MGMVVVVVDGCSWEEGLFVGFCCFYIRGVF